MTVDPTLVEYVRLLPSDPDASDRAIARRTATACCHPRPYIRVQSA